MPEMSLHAEPPSLCSPQACSTALQTWGWSGVCLWVTDLESSDICVQLGKLRPIPGFLWGVTSQLPNLDTET